MNGPTWVWGIVSWVLCAYIGCAGQAAAQAAPGDIVLNLHGTVVDGATGRPLARSLVVSMDHRLATMTNADGHFAVALHLPPQAGQLTGGTLGPQGYPLMLSAQKPGYIATPSVRSFSLDSSLDSTEVQLKLMPSGSITGLVTAEGATAASNVRITLLQHRVQDGVYQWQFATSHSTNAHGEFRFTGLVPGDYSVVTLAWHGPSTLPQRTQASVEYPSVFPGDTSTMTSASVLRVRYGEAATTELHLHRTTLYPVSIPVTLEREHGNVMARVLGEKSLGTPALPYNEQDGAVEGRLPDGDYSILLMGMPTDLPQGQSSPMSPRRARQSSAVVHIHVAGEAVRTAAATLAPVPPVEVHVRAESTNGAQQSFFAGVTLMGEDFSLGSYGGNLQPKDGETFFIENVPPGRYRAVANTGDYVASLTYGSTDLLTEPLVIGAGGLQQPIELSVGSNGGVISGSVLNASGGTGDHTYLVLLPVSSSARFSQGGVGADGHFNLPNVAPGNYRLFAANSPPMQLPYREPDALRALGSLGVAVSIAAGQHLEVDAPLVDTGQAVGPGDASSNMQELMLP